MRKFLSRSGGTTYFGKFKVDPVWGRHHLKCKLVAIYMVIKNFRHSMLNYYYLIGQLVVPLGSTFYFPPMLNYFNFGRIWLTGGAVYTKYILSSWNIPSKCNNSLSPELMCYQIPQYYHFWVGWFHIQLKRPILFWSVECSNCKGTVFWLFIIII